MRRVLPALWWRTRTALGSSGRSSFRPCSRSRAATWIGGDLPEARDLAERARQIAEATGDELGRPVARVLSLQAVACAPGGADIARLELAAVVVEEAGRVPALAAPMLDACRLRLTGAVGAPEAKAGAEYKVALARNALAHDDVGAVSGLLEPVIESTGLPKATAVEAAVLLSIAAERRESAEEACRWIELALEVAESDAIRDRSPTPGEVHAILRGAIRRGTAHRWLAGSLLAVLDGREASEGHGTRELLDPLSARETVVLRYLPTLLSNQEIAGELFVSVNTVKTHLKSIYRKLGVSDRRAAVRLARDLGSSADLRPTRRASRRLLSRSHGVHYR